MRLLCINRTGRNFIRYQYTGIFVLLLSLVFFTPAYSYSKESKKRNITDFKVMAVIEFYNNNQAYLKVVSKVPRAKEPVEMARLLSHWFCKILYLLPEPMPRIVLMQEVKDSLVEPKLKPRENVLRRTRVDDFVKMVSKPTGKPISSIHLYLKRLPSGKRGLLSFVKGEATEQQAVFSWAIILQYAAFNYTQRQLDFICDIMGETIRSYSAGADPSSVENIFIIPNNSFDKVKQNK